MTHMLAEEELIYDWNTCDQELWPSKPPRIVDHTVDAVSDRRRAQENPDGCWDTGQKREVLSHLANLGLETAVVGDWDQRCLRELAASAPLQCAFELGQECAFEAQLPGQVPARIYSSTFHPDFSKHGAVAHPEKIMVLQDCCRQTPSALVQAVSLAKSGGFVGLCLSDDTGRALPVGAFKLVQFVLQVAARLSHPLEIEWSGRNDRGLALANALQAWRAGASAIHSAFFGLGEGSGLVPSELLLVNLKLYGALKRDLTGLRAASEALAALTATEVHPNAPVIGGDAFRTGTGVHAAAIVKAHKKGHDWLADLIYSGIPACQFGYRQIIEVGPMAGASNVQFWLRSNGYPVDEQLVGRILAQAKSSDRVLSENELHQLVGSRHSGQ